MDSSQFYCFQKFIGITAHAQATLLVPFMVLGFDANDWQQSSLAVRCCNKRALFILGTVWQINTASWSLTSQTQSSI